MAKNLATKRPTRDRGGEVLKRLKADPEMAEEIATMRRESGGNQKGSIWRIFRPSERPPN